MNPGETHAGGVRGEIGGSATTQASRGNPTQYAPAISDGISLLRTLAANGSVRDANGSTEEAPLVLLEVPEVLLQVVTASRAPREYP